MRALSYLILFVIFVYGSILIWAVFNPYPVSFICFDAFGMPWSGLTDDIFKVDWESNIPVEAWFTNGALCLVNLAIMYGMYNGVKFMDRKWKRISEPRRKTTEKK